MEYKPMELKSHLYGLAVRKSVGQEATAVLENLSSSYDYENLKPILNEMKQAGIRNIVLDLSHFPASSRGDRLLFLDGVLTVLQFEARYIGTTPDEVIADAVANDPYRSSSVENIGYLSKYISPIIAESLDVAVESFSQQ